MKRKFISSVIALALVLPLGVTTVLASENDAYSVVPASAQAPFSFSLQRGAASSSSSAAYKNDNTAAEVYPQRGTISSANKVAFRVRNADRSEATGLYERTDLSGFSLYYYPGTPTNENKYLYANAPSGNQAQWVEVSGVWYP